MTSDTPNSVCGPCSRLDQTLIATQWCIDCEEPLCQVCVNAHKAIKSLNSHHLIGLDAAQSLPKGTLICNKNCLKHEEFLLDYLCTYHDVLCCRGCITDEHRHCEKIIPLEMAAKDVSTSTLCHDIIDGLHHIGQTLERLVENRTTNIEKIKQQHSEILQAVSEHKTSILTSLHETEIVITSEANTSLHKAVSKLEDERSKANLTISSLRKHLQNIDFMTKNCSNTHVFLFLQELRNILCNEDQKIKLLLSNLEDVSLVYRESEEVLYSIKCLGTVQSKLDLCGIQYSTPKCTEAQKIATEGTKPIKSFKFESKFDVKDPETSVAAEISGIVVTSDNKLVLSNHKDSNLFMYSIDGKYIDICKLASIPWGIAYNKQSGTIVAGLKDKKSIQMVDRFKAGSTIYVSNTYCYGIAWVRNNIYVGGLKELYILKADGSHIKKLSINCTGSIYHIHYSTNKVYLTDYNKVYCIKEDGTNIFTFSSPELRGLYGITTDASGNVYVVGRVSRNIHRLSIDGTNSDIMISKADRLNYPMTLCYSKDYKKLFVSNEDGKVVSVFNCEF